MFRPLRWLVASGMVPIAVVALTGAAPDSVRGHAVFGPMQRQMDSLMALPDSEWSVPPGVNRQELIRFMRRMYRSPDSTFAGPDSAHRTDAQMKADFLAHERDFQRLLEMFRTDSTLERVSAPDPMFTPPSPLPAERQKAYDRLFAKLGVRMIVRERGDLILLRTTTVWTFDRRGYAWSSRVPDRLVDRETTTVGSTGPFRVYRRLKGGWYIFYQSSS